MANIGLIDADLLDGGTRFPNLALMKLSGYFEDGGDNTRLISYGDIPKYNKVYLSKVFDFTNIPINLKFYPQLEYGGTGFNYDKNDFLPSEIEHHKPNYDLYNEYTDVSKYYSNHSIGFTTRFCFRQCSFCVNRDKEKVVEWSPIEEFDDKNNDYITLLDDNVLGSPNRIDIIKQLQNTNKPFEFKQGIDLRLINDEIAYLLNNSKYHGEFIFAFDNIEDKNKIIEKLNLWKKYNNSIVKFYVLTAFNEGGNYDQEFWVNDIINTFERIKILMKHRSLPYIMRYNKYKQSKYKGIYTTIARWCNQPSFFKKKSFKEFCYANGENSASVRYIEQFKNEHPQIAAEYFDMKWEDFN